MNLGSKKYIDILLDDWVYRKVYVADREGHCSICGKDVSPGDKIVFLTQPSEGKPVVMIMCDMCKWRVYDSVVGIREKDNYEKYIIDVED